MTLDQEGINHAARAGFSIHPTGMEVWKCRPGALGEAFGK